MELSSQAPARARRAWSDGGLHWPLGLPQRAVAEAFLQDVLCCLVLQTAGTQGIRDSPRVGSHVVAHSVVPRTESLQADLEDVW